MVKSQEEYDEEDRIYHEITEQIGSHDTIGPIGGYEDQKATDMLGVVHIDGKPVLISWYREYPDETWTGYDYDDHWGGLAHSQ